MKTTMNNMITDNNIRENFEETTQEIRAAKRGFMAKAATVAGFLYTSEIMQHMSVRKEGREIYVRDKGKDQYGDMLCKHN